MTMKQIPLNGKYGKGKFALVDDEDYEELMQHKWIMQKRGYIINRSTRDTIYLHRFILKPNKGLVIDHVNHDKLDNQKINLRACSQGQNMANRKTNKVGSSKFKGVSFNKTTNKWYSKIQFNYKQFNLGYFDTELEAAQAYNAKALELFGGFAHLNKI